MPHNKELAEDLAKMLDKHNRDVSRFMKRHDVDFMKICYAYDGKITYKMRTKTHVRNDIGPNYIPDPDHVAMQSVGEPSN